jgi:hypothetical protein
VSFFKNPFSDAVTNEVAPDRKVVPLPPVDRNAQLAQALQEPIRQAVVPQRITYDLIRQTIVQVRVNDLIGKGKWSKDERLAEDLFCLVRHYEPDTKLTYERIMQAIVFVKTNEIMGAGQWSKEDHLAEYLYALVRLSGTDSPAMRASEQMEMTITAAPAKRANNKLPATTETL